MTRAYLTLRVRLEAPGDGTYQARTELATSVSGPDRPDVRDYIAGLLEAARAGLRGEAERRQIEEASQ